MHMFLYASEITAKHVLKNDIRRQPLGHYMDMKVLMTKVPAVLELFRIE